MNGPAGLSLDAAGNLYIADRNNNVIRQVNLATGLISTLAGTGVAGYSGDGSDASQALLNAPFATLAINNGDIYVTDTGNNVLRIIDHTTGKIATLAGTGVAGYNGDQGIGLAAQLSGPTGMAEDPAGNLYIADSNNNVIRKYYPETGLIDTVAGNGFAGTFSNTDAARDASLSDPIGVVFDATGTLYLADTRSNVVAMVGGGPIQAPVLPPTSVANAIVYAVNPYALLTGNRKPPT